MDNFLKSDKNVSESPPPPPPPRWVSDFFRAGAKLYGSHSSSETFWQFCPPEQTPWLRPCPYPIMVIIENNTAPPPPPPAAADCRFQGWRNAQRDILPGLWKCCYHHFPGVVWYGSGVAGCSWWGDGTMLWDRVRLNVVGWGWGKRWDTSYTAQTHIHRN